MNTLHQVYLHNIDDIADLNTREISTQPVENLWKTFHIIKAFQCVRICNAVCNTVITLVNLPHNFQQQDNHSAIFKKVAVRMVLYSTVNITLFSCRYVLHQFRATTNTNTRAKAPVKAIWTASSIVFSLSLWK